MQSKQASKVGSVTERVDKRRAARLRQQALALLEALHVAALRLVLLLQRRQLGLGRRQRLRAAIAKPCIYPILWLGRGSVWCAGCMLACSLPARRSSTSGGDLPRTLPAKQSRSGRTPEHARRLPADLRLL